MLYSLGESKVFLFGMKPINEENKITQSSTGYSHLILNDSDNLPMFCLFHRRFILDAQHNLLKEIKYCTLLNQLMNKAIKSNFITK